jgi:hypothetical protein
VRCTHPGDRLYDLLLQEFPDWLSAAGTAGILR